MTHARIIALTLLAMIAFAGNSLLCRAALKHTAIDAASFTTIRLISGAIVLWLVVDTITSSFGTQLLFLLGYGVVVSLWLIIRTRKILQQHNS